MVHVRKQSGACLSGALHKLQQSVHVRKVPGPGQSHSGMLTEYTYHHACPPGLGEKENNFVLTSFTPALLPQVALKRIPDVLSSPEQAKRVLREVCILRRLRQEARALQTLVIAN